MRPWLRPVLIGLAIACFCGPGGAASPETCSRYAEDAAAQFFRMRNTAGCRQRSSNLWHADRPRHYSWCLSAHPAAVRGQLRRRDEIIASCDPSYGD